jgi:hypothetical protein
MALMNQLVLSNLGQLTNASIDFGDLTVLVGPQASGKTVFLEMLKLVVDTGHIHSQLATHGLDWGNDPVKFLNLFLGEGMGGILRQNSEVRVDGSVGPVNDLATRRNRSRKHRLFYVPAQRVMTINNGWPRSFQNYGLQDPYVVREFSETFRRLMEKEVSVGGALFPQTQRLKKAYRDALRNTIFRGFELRIDTHGSQRQLMLGRGETEARIPFMTWSSGQREFVPLLMGLYWLLPASKVSRRDDIQWVVLEELEAGLHPSAITSVLLIVLDLLARGYRVCLSTHSPHVLEMVWAIRELQLQKASVDSCLRLFDAPRNQQTRKVASTALEKDYRVYFFDNSTGTTRDISSLDPAASDFAEADWGGLTSFSSRAADTVADVVAENPG